MGKGERRGRGVQLQPPRLKGEEREKREGGGDRERSGRCVQVQPPRLKGGGRKGERKGRGVTERERGKEGERCAGLASRMWPGLAQPF